ncbi:MAG: hypothetical protein JW997_07775, partial [Actinobacteria bacterium]|nr:hypothetical protein [Actinomycetota bacterium]
MHQFIFNRNRNLLISFLISMLCITFIISIMITAKSDTFFNLIEIKGATAQALQPYEETVNQPQNNAVNLTDYEAAILHLINTVRADRGLASLQPNQSLIDISRTRSNDMLSRNYFSHYTPEGKNVFNIFRECGITFSAAGENLAHSRPADIGTPEAFINAWMNSPAHAANILQGKYGIIGVGMIENSGRRVVTTV